MDAFIPVIHGLAADRPDDLDGVSAAREVAAALARIGYVSETVVLDIDLTAIERLAARRPVVVFNLCDAIRGDGRLGAIACAALDHFHLSYTGAGSTAYLQSASKLLSKALLRSAGLPTPDWWLGDAPPGRPVIVKSVDEHASYGIDQDSVVDGARAAVEIARREQRFGGRFFAEAYIAGREFNVSVIERDGAPMVLPIAEMDFAGLPDDVLPIVDYGAKWDEASPGYFGIGRGFGLEAAEPGLAARIRALTLECWAAAGLSGYGRIDFRVGPDGAPLILEFNANPCLSGDAGFAAALDRAGLGYDQAIAAIVAAGRR